VSNEKQFFARAEALLARLEQLLPGVPTAPDWESAVAFRWHKDHYGGVLKPIHHTSSVYLNDLQCVDRPKREVDLNTRQFINKLPANNVLLWGPRGTGKSSLIKALLNEYAPRGLRLVEVERQHLTDFPEVVDLLSKRPERFVVFCDDLSFMSDDGNYKTVKVLLDGSISSTPDNVLVYATSNRRHLLPEYQCDHSERAERTEEIHYSEAVEEKISLAERFGLWLAFHPFSQDDFLRIVFHWLDRLDVAVDDKDDVRAAALRWALLHGSRSGRSAWQFACDWAGKKGLGL
jgi:predicted AAA+ superfamily ATPase